MDELLEHFKTESMQLLKSMEEILVELEANPDNSKRLSEVGQLVDRIMGSAKTIVQNSQDNRLIQVIADYAELCKLISYKTSQIQNEKNLLTVIVALLLDGTEMMEDLLSQVGEKTQIQLPFTKQYLERLRWALTQLSSELKGSVGLSSVEGGPQVSQTAAPASQSIGDKTKEQRMKDLMALLGDE